MTNINPQDLQAAIEVITDPRHADTSLSAPGGHRAVNRTKVLSVLHGAHDFDWKYAAELFDAALVEVGGFEDDIAEPPSHPDGSQMLVERWLIPEETE